MPAIAVISSRSLDSTRYFESLSEDGSTVFVNITEANVELEDKEEEEFDLVIERFNNNDDTLCPLLYRLSNSR
jgi:hypothetical protein